MLRIIEDLAGDWRITSARRPKMEAGRSLSNLAQPNYIWVARLG
jgi:hypothetical protein